MFTAFSIAKELQAAVAKQREALVAAAPNADALRALVPAWYDLVDLIIFDIEIQIVTYRGRDISVLLRWSDAWSNTRFDPTAWDSYNVFVMDAPTSIVLGE